jgi:hypothetical protein
VFAQCRKTFVIKEVVEVVVVVVVVVKGQGHNDLIIV